MTNTALAADRGPSKHVSLSTYFPVGTHYFYGYPAGENSHFLNKVPPETDELVAARALCCAGSDVSVVSFASTSAPLIDRSLIEKLAIPQLPNDHTDLLPVSIDTTLTGKARNDAIMAALARTIAPRSLVMAQPFVSHRIDSLYEIAPDITIWLNDKSNMADYIREDMMPARFAAYPSGVTFAEDMDLLERTDIIPCVIKVASSSSGDGVYLCHTLDELKAAQADVASIDVSVVVEQLVRERRNYAIHFGIPHDRNQPIDIIGYNEQLTSDEGEFLGGVITDEAFPPVLDEVRQYLLDEVLPAVRARGWYGIGGYDVIIDDVGRPYLIDGNFRMTGMSAYHFLMANGVITRPMVSFGGTFIGTQVEFERAILPFASADVDHRTVQLIALSRHGDRWDFNGALMYTSQNDLRSSIHSLLAAGITSPALDLQNIDKVL